MNRKPTLVIMAAGMGSRYGGLKQIDPMDPQGHIIMDFSVYDAVQAGFEKVVFIIKHAIEKDFKEAIGNRLEKQLEVKYVFQELTECIPEGCSVPEGREKPLGTGHAILCCKDVIDGPFMVINADDFYGRDAFRVMYNQLLKQQDDDMYRYSMVGYRLGNTLTDNGYVTRGVCRTDENSHLTQVWECMHIEKDTEENAKYTQDGGTDYRPIPMDTTVSMNFWGFNPSLFGELESRMRRFLKEEVPKNPVKAEFLIPNIVGELIAEGKASVDVLHSQDKWFGVTYKEDKPVVMASIAKMKEEGKYPEYLWK